MPSKEELFGGHRGGYRSGGPVAPEHSGAQVTKRFEDYKDALRKSHAEHDEGRDVLIPGEGLYKGARPSKAEHERRMETIEQLSKSLPADQLAAMQAGLDDLRGTVTKDWNQAFPETGGYNTQLAPFDLEAPAKILVPRQTPLRNAVPRNNTGKGSAVQFRRILGWTNAQALGGVPDVSPFLNSEFPSGTLPVFGGNSTAQGTATSGLSLRRGQKITYAADSKTINYTELSLSDSVSWKAQYIGQGFEDIRQLSHTATLWAHMLGEEKAMLYGRGPTANGYKGPIAAPGAPTVATAGTGGTIAAGTYGVVLTAIGGFGESVATAAAPVTTTGTTSTITVTLPPLPAGGLGWNVYAATAAPFVFQTSAPAGTLTVTLTALNTTNAGIAASAADTSALPNGYDGFLTVLTDPTQSGYVATYQVAATAANTINSIGGLTLVGGSVPPPQGDAPFQAMFKALYGAGVEPGNYATSGAAASQGQKLLADPDVVYLDGTIRSALGSYVERGGNSGATGSAGGYRIMITSDAVSGVQVGSVVTGLVNQTTGKSVDLEVHPYMPPGVAFAWSKTLPVPDSEIANTFEVRNVVDYTGYDWPDIQFTYDFSTYQLGTFVPYAPAWSGAIVGLVA